MTIDESADEGQLGESLCWDCKKATGDCSWSAFFVPVKGWEAKQTKISNGKKSAKIKSCLVRKCPLFEQDDERNVYSKKRLREVRLQIRGLLKISERSFHRQKEDGRLEQKLDKIGASDLLEKYDAICEDREAWNKK